MTLLHALLLPAHAWTATFDARVEGETATSFVEDGIVCGDVDNLLDPPPTVMIIERGDATLAGFPAFTSPNTLSFGGYSPGPNAAFGRFGSMTITPPSTASDVTVEVFNVPNSPTTLRLEASLAGSVVGQSDVIISGYAPPYHHTLELHGIAFDELRLLGGGNGQTAVFISIDTIEITPAPVDDTDVEPDTDIAPDTSDTDLAAETDLPPDTDVPPDTELADTDLPDDANQPDGDGELTRRRVSTCGCAGGSGRPIVSLGLIGAMLLRRRPSARRPASAPTTSRSPA